MNKPIFYHLTQDINRLNCGSAKAGEVVRLINHDDQGPIVETLDERFSFCADDTDLIGIYTLERQMLPDWWDPTFAFNAMDEQDALQKAQGWARYHSFNPRQVRIRPANRKEATYWMHNEWVD